jgi:phospholipase C
MKLGSDSLQKIVSSIDGTPIALGDVLALNQFSRAHDAVPKIADPLHILVIAQSAAAIFHVRLLHKHRASVFPMALFLIFQAPPQVVAHLSSHAMVKEFATKLGMKTPIARKIP